MYSLTQATKFQVKFDADLPLLFKNQSVIKKPNFESNYRLKTAFFAIHLPLFIINLNKNSRCDSLYLLPYPL